LHREQHIINAGIIIAITLDENDQSKKIYGGSLSGNSGKITLKMEIAKAISLSGLSSSCQRLHRSNNKLYEKNQQEQIFT
jgi:hypothetical protein